jgi:iron(III) transport system permease protein
MTVASLPASATDPFARPRLRRPRHPLATTIVVAAALLVATPLAGLLAIAAKGDAEIWSHLVAYVLAPSLVDTVLLLAGVATVTTVVGVGTAWLVTAFEFPGRKALLWLLPLPLAIPTYIVAYVYVDLLDAWGPVQVLLRAVTGWTSPTQYWFPSARSLPGAILLMGFVLYPYVHLAARTMFQTQSAALVEIARTMGAGPWRIARDVTLPLARPAVVAGLTLVLLEALNDIGLCEYLGVRTLTISIFTTWLNRGSLPGAAQIALMLLALVAILMAVERHARRNRRYATGDAGPPPARKRLRGGRALLAAAACLLPVGLGFLVPFTYLLEQAVSRTLLFGLDRDLARHAATTAGLATLATMTTLALGVALVSATRLLRRPYARMCLAIAGLGYAIPGTVLALGLLTPLITTDQIVDRFVRAVGGGGVGLLLAGSGAAVVIAYVVRFLAIVIGLAHAAFGRISTDLDDAARSAGARPGKVVLSIHAPLARAALAGAALLVFVDCLKELPATLLLRPLNVETLSTYLYQFATRGSFEDGAVAALLIVLAGLLPVMHIVKLADTAGPLGHPIGTTSSGGHRIP